MTLQFDAIYENGVLRPKQPIVLPNGTEVRGAIDTANLPVDPLASVIGIVDGTGPVDGAEAHDEYIYGNRHS